MITAAASIMIVVFGSFALGDDRIIKLFGIGLASAVFFDAVIIRCLLVRRSWSCSAAGRGGCRSWLDRRLPRVAIEAPDERRAAEQPASVSSPA